MVIKAQLGEEGCVIHCYDNSKGKSEPLASLAYDTPIELVPKEQLRVDISELRVLATQKYIRRMGVQGYIGSTGE